MRAIIALVLALSLVPVPAFGATYEPTVRQIQASYGAPEWAAVACMRSLDREHYACGGCAKCQRNAARHRGHVGPLQFNSNWNRNHVGCGHGYADWRYCLDCSVSRFMRVATQVGKRGIRRHWGQTCGRLR